MVTLDSHRSLTTEDADADSELDRVDMTAARIAASMSPTKPVFGGNEWMIKCAKTWSGLVPSGSRLD